MLVFLVFFFKQKTAYELRISDWSSDVCSSDGTARRSARPAQQTQRAGARSGDEARRIGAGRPRDRAAARLRTDRAVGGPARNRRLRAADRAGSERSQLVAVLFGLGVQRSKEGRVWKEWVGKCSAGWA